MKTMEVWNSVRVINSYDLVKRYTEETGEIGVYLMPQVNDGSRMSMGSPDGVIVIRPGFKTAPDTNRWQNYGNMVFDRFSYGYDMANAMDAAQEWVFEKYCVGPEFGAIVGFGRDRFPIQIVTWAKQKFTQIKKEAQQ